MIARQRAFSLTCMDQSVGMECLAINGAASNFTDRVDFVLRHLHGPKNVLKFSALVTRAQIMEDCMVGIVSAENRHEAAVQPINQRIAHTLGESVASAAYSTVCIVDRGKGPFPVDRRRTDTNVAACT